MPTPPPPRARGILERLHRFAFVSSCVYALLIALLATPWFQRHVLYQHALRLPLFANFDLPEKYGLAPGKTMNLKLTTPDSVTIGAWFVLSEPFYQSYRPSSPGDLTQPSLEAVQTAVHTYPTILFCHGTAATRAQWGRILTYSSFTSRLHANVLAIDYRGFADSEGTPSDTGLVEDAQTAWRWLMEQGTRPEDVLIVGHSLGTGVVAALASALAREDIKPRGVVLLSPFTNLANLLETYSIEGIPVLQPLQTFAIGRRLIKWLTRHEFNTLSVIHEINAPVLIAHSQNDMDIPYHHSRTLLDRLLDPHLPAGLSLPTTPDVTFSSDDYTAYVENQQQRRTARSELVRKVELPNFGTIEEFDGAAGKVVYVEAFWGKHNEVGLQEGVQDIIASTFHLGPTL